MLETLFDFELPETPQPETVADKMKLRNEATRLDGFARTEAGVLFSQDADFSKFPLYLDIETIPDESRLDLFGLEPLPIPPAITPMDRCPEISAVLAGTLDQIDETIRAANPCGQWLAELMAAEQQRQKPRAGIRQAVERMLDSRGKIESAADERRKLLSVTPEFCRVVAIGFAVGDTEPESMVCGDFNSENPATELAILREFWRLVGGRIGQIVGYNVAGFDLPVLLVRSALLDVSPSRLIDRRPWGRDVIDLMECRYGRGRAAKLKDLARWLGIDVPAEGVDGSQVETLWRTDPARLGEYVRSDVVITRELHRLMRGYWCS